MSEKYRFKKVIDKLAAIYCGSLLRGPSIVRDFLVEMFHPKKTAYWRGKTVIHSIVFVIFET